MLGYTFQMLKVRTSETTTFHLIICTSALENYIISFYLGPRA